MKGVKRGFLKVGAQICFLPSKIPQQFVPPGKILEVAKIRWYLPANKRKK